MIKSPFPGEFDALARQYWNAWNEMLGQPGGFQGWAPPGGLPGGMNNPFAAAGLGNNPFANNPFAASLAGMGGVGGGLPPGTITEDFAKIDRNGTWLKRPPTDYTPTSFDKFWVPNEDLLQEWVRALALIFQNNINLY